LPLMMAAASEVACFGPSDAPSLDTVTANRFRFALWPFIDGSRRQVGVSATGAVYMDGSSY